MTSEWGASRGVFYGASALLFAASSALTIVWGASMSAMGGMPMAGGWSMSMTWMRMPGQSWAEVATTFAGMWTMMMVAMMLPSLAPVLHRHHQAVAIVRESRAGRLTMLVGGSYFLVWAIVGLAIFPLGVALAALAMREPTLAGAAPIAGSVVVLSAGALQFSERKAHHLQCWRGAFRDGGTIASDARTAWRDGVRLAIRCIACSLGPMAVLFVLGVMDLRAMAVVGAAITAERVVPAGECVARGLGVAAVSAALVLIARAG